jgi:uncharacterized lipoprotein YmbA
MTTRLPVILALAGSLLGLAGCVSLKRTPEARFFVLRSVVEPPQAPPSVATGGLVGVQPVRLPGHLERPQLVIWRAPSELYVDEFLRWSEPLDAGITRTLAEDLAALLPEQRVIRHPWPGGAELRCRVAVEIEVFGQQQDGEIRLEGRWALLPARVQRPLAFSSVSLTRGPLVAEGVADPRASVDAMSELIADLSRQIAAAVRALPVEAPESTAEEATTAP